MKVRPLGEVTQLEEVFGGFLGHLLLCLESGAGLSLSFLQCPLICLLAPGDNVSILPSFIGS